MLASHVIEAFEAEECVIGEKICIYAIENEGAECDMPNRHTPICAICEEPTHSAICEKIGGYVTVRIAHSVLYVAG